MRAKYLKVITDKGEVIEIRNRLPRLLQSGVLERKLILIKDLYQGWCSLSERVYCEQEKEICESLLEKFLGLTSSSDLRESFIDDEDLVERVEAWIEKTEQRLMEKFEERLRKACLNRLR